MGHIILSDQERALFTSRRSDIGVVMNVYVTFATESIIVMYSSLRIGILILKPYYIFIYLLIS